jgi:hypothetical protein
VVGYDSRSTNTQNEYDVVFLGSFGFMLQVTFLGDGPLGQMTSISSAGSFVKGFVGNPLCQPPLKDNGKV